MSPGLTAGRTIIYARPAHNLETFIVLMKLFKCMVKAVSPATPRGSRRARIGYIFDRVAIEGSIFAGLSEWLGLGFHDFTLSINGSWSSLGQNFNVKLGNIRTRPEKSKNLAISFFDRNP